jgi:ABC-type lipoprotein export system ATPase subunit
MIKLEKVNKYFYRHKKNEIHVINNTNLEIQAPGLVTFLGSSGAGKSTLLHVIGGLDKASGDVIYDNINFNKASKRVVDDYRNKHIGYIFQNYNLLPNLTVYENLKVQLELIQVFDKETVDKKINECLKIVGMEKYKRRKVTALSGGQQQRVSIARALVKGADVIIADEPTGNLDTKNSIEILNILKILSKKYLIVLVTHDLNLAMHYSDRIIKIKDGTIIEDVVNENNNSLLHTDSNALYLDDYEQNSFANNKSSLSFAVSNLPFLSLTLIPRLILPAAILVDRFLSDVKSLALALNPLNPGISCNDKEKFLNNSPIGPSAIP